MCGLVEWNPIFRGLFEWNPIFGGLFEWIPIFRGLFEWNPIFRGLCVSYISVFTLEIQISRWAGLGDH
jgi:hypothetical protein